MPRVGRSVADAVPWARERIEAWVNEHDGRGDLSERYRHQVRLTRATMVRLCPEAPDYEALLCQWDALLRERPELRVTDGWRESATDAEIVERTEAMAGALWALSISDSRSEEATP